MRGPYDEREPVHIPDEIERRYVVREVKQRIHQAQFRGAVLPAYSDRCAICRLREVRLLDAAHIVADADEAGVPIVANGLSLCSIHHRAFDEDLVGVAPDLRVHVSRRLLEDDDGPMLDVLKTFHGKTIDAPGKRSGVRIPTASPSGSNGSPPHTRPSLVTLLCGTIAAVETTRIAALPVFAGLPPAELDELAAVMSEVQVDAGSNVVTVDDYGSAIYFIEEGEADVVTESGEGAQPLGPGDTFGEISPLLTGQRTATVVARTPMRLLSLSGHDFERTRARVPGAESALRRLGLERAAR